jgi:adenylylsulfate kinase
MKILVMGLPGAGKTHLAERLSKFLGCAWYNADKVREMANDWDFSPEGRLRQAKRMKLIANFESDNGRTVICDFVCPTKNTRTMFSPDLTFWVDTLEQGRFEDTNKIFEKPTNADFHITHYLNDKDIESIGSHLKETYNV